MNIIYGIFFIIFGLITGSFLNVCILECKEEELFDFPNNFDELSKKEKVEVEERFKAFKKEQLSKKIKAFKIFVTRKSHCMSCGYELKPYDMIPILSFFIYKGKCRKCGEKLSIQYPIVEGLNAILYFIILYANDFQINITTIFMCIIASILLLVSVVDIRIMEMPNIASIIIATIGISKLIYEYREGIYQFSKFSLIFSIIFFIILFVACWFDYVGFGDFKLLLACSFFIGIRNIIISYILASIFGTIVYVPQLVIKARKSKKEQEEKINKNDKSEVETEKVRENIENNKENNKEGLSLKKQIPFGPFLALGIFITMLYGDAIFYNYLSLIGINKLF